MHVQDSAVQHRKYMTAFESCTQTVKVPHRTAPARSLPHTELAFHRKKKKSKQFDLSEGHGVKVSITEVISVNKAAKFQHRTG